MLKKWLLMPSTWKGIMLLGAGLVDYLQASPQYSIYASTAVGAWETLRKGRVLNFR